MKKLLLPLLSPLLLPLFFALSLAACSPQAQTAFKGVDLTGAEYARGFRMKDIDGKERTLDEFKGKVVVVFFGYTQCPDVCPTTMAELAQVKKNLGADGDKVQGIFVTIDPERDTPELLKAYLGSFDKSFVALRGNDDETRAIAKEFKSFYAKAPGKEPGQYSMDHTAASYVFDPQGRIRVFEKYGLGPQALVDDIKLLLGGA